MWPSIAYVPATAGFVDFSIYTSQFPLEFSWFKNPKFINEFF